MRCCNTEMSERRSRQYNENIHECAICRRTVAVDDNGNVEILSEGRK